tara:strand:+ start:38 stop:316 length:279 start_codon:yes stop_codon:yes gene_type:complete
MKTKYAVPRGLVDDLMKSGMVHDEEAALEKVASGEALDALLQRKKAQLDGLEIEFKHFGSRGIILADNLDSTRASIEELENLIELRDAPSEV